MNYMENAIPVAFVNVLGSSIHRQAVTKTSSRRDHHITHRHAAVQRTANQCVVTERSSPKTFQRTLSDVLFQTGSSQGKQGIILWVIQFVICKETAHFFTAVDEYSKIFRLDDTCVKGVYIDEDYFVVTDNVVVINKCRFLIMNTKFIA